MNKEDRLIWVDMEMTGLKPDIDTVLEIATIVTDKHLNVLAEGPVICIHHDDHVLNNMDPWCINQHEKTGLTRKCRDSATSLSEAEEETLSFLIEHAPKKKSPMCGNSVHLDRSFMSKHMPALEAYFHYRNVDVSSIQELASRWKPSMPEYQKRLTHRALDDIRDSINQLKHYKKYFFDL